MSIHFPFLRKSGLFFMMLCLAGLLSCSRKQEQTAQNGGQQTAQTPGVTVGQPPAPVKPPILRIYFEKEPVPQAFLDVWPGRAGIEISQTHLTMSGDGKWPADGDLYIVSPRFFASLSSQVPMQEWPDRTLLEGVNPAFTDHAFDPQNKYTRPWRWTPYVFYIRQVVEGKTAVFDFHDWTVDDQSLWPSDWELLLGMKRHLEGKSANSAKPENTLKDAEALKERLKEHAVSEEECWKALQEGRIQRTFLPASLRLRQAEDPAIKNVDWLVTPRGTLTQFDHLVVAASSPRKEVAQGLVQFLLQPGQQSLLLRESGYLPVVTTVGHEVELTEIKLSPLQVKQLSGSWFNLTEFLVDKAQMPPTSAAVLQPVQAAPVSPVTPAGK